MLRFVVFGCLTLLGVVTARITVTVSKTRYNIQAGDDVTLQCTITADQGLDKVYWEHGQRTVFSSHDRRRYTKYSGSLIADPSLIIHSTTESDTGYYYCNGVKGRTNRQSVWIYLSIQAASIDVTVSKTRYNIQAGFDVILQCSIDADQGLDEVYWKKDYYSGIVYSSSARGRNTKYSGSSITNPSLTIHSTTASDTGSNYQCFGKKGSSTGKSEQINLRVTEVTVPQTTYSVTAGTSVTLQCSISPRNGLTTVYWTKARRNSEVYSSDSSTNYKYSGSTRNNPPLTIHNTAIDDTGSYTCRGRKASGDYSSSPINLSSSPIQLTVFKPFTVSILPDSTDIAVQEGSYVPSRTCESDDCLPDCEKEWIVPTGERRKSDIFAKYITREDVGMYTCTVSIGGLNNSESFHVTVNYGPTTISLTPPENVSVQEGHQLSVQCQASCFPSCDIIWTRPNVYRAVRRGPDLRIHSADRADRGIYVCSASNEFGNSSTSLAIDVKYGPRKISLEPTTQSYGILEGDMMERITCTADCNPPCHFTWTRDGQSVGNDNTLSLGTLNSNKDGTYTCTARGRNTNRKTNINVKTLYGPKTISLSPSGDVSVQEGDRISVQCQASCSPSCEIKWTGPNVYQGGRRGPDLRIEHADRADGGLYDCLATNEIGNKSTSVRINVNYAGSDIRLIPRETHYSYKEGTVVQDIQCMAECNPACQMSWHHDRTGRVFEGGNLSLKNMNRSKDGNYMCKAVNSQGNQTLHVNVVSLFPPTVLRQDLLNSSYVVDLGDTLLSSISVDSSPTPLADLLYEGNDQHFGNYISIQQKRHGYYWTDFTYSISNITYSDLGQYTLNVSNSQGTFLYKFSINVIGNGPLGREGGGADHLTAVWIIVILVLTAIIISVIVTIIVFKRKHNKERTRRESSVVTFNGVHNAAYEHREIAPAVLRGFSQQPDDDAGSYIEIHNPGAQSNPVNDVYAKVVRPSRSNNGASSSAEYANVRKSINTGGATAAGTSDSTLTKTTDGNHEQGPSSSRSTNREGLVYLEVDFTNKSDNAGTGQIVIRGIENKCDYGEIDFTKKGELPEDADH